MTTVHLAADALAEGLDAIKASPKDRGTLELIVARPAVGARESINESELSSERGLLGDTWLARGSKRTPDGRSNVEQQLTLMNARAIALIAAARERWALAGDQLYVDLDLSVENLPIGVRLAVGEAVVEITAAPHLGCGKFKERFGDDAVGFVNSPVGRALRLRGVNARVIVGGKIRVGDRVAKL